MLNYLRRASRRAVAAAHSSAPGNAQPRHHIHEAAAQFSAPSRLIAAPRSRVRRDYVANDVSGVLAGVAIVGTLIGVGKMWWDASSPSSKELPLPRVDISRDDLVQFFVDLTASIQQLFKQLPEIDEKFREHLKSQNVELGEAEYKQTLLQQLYDVLQSIEQQVVSARGWNREAFGRALEMFGEDEEIVRLQRELQTIMHAVFPPPEIPEHLTPEKTLEIITALTKGMEQAMHEMLRHARAEGITDPAKAMEEFQQIYLDQVEQITFDEMKKNDVSNDMFNVALQKYYGENAEFRKKVEQLYAEQAEVFRRLGLPVDADK